MNLGKYFRDGLAASFDPSSKGLYLCECGWSGKGLAYAGVDGKGHVSPRPYKPYQGYCPECGRPFAGTRKG